MMAEPRTIPLYPLPAEHLKPMAVDAAAFMVTLVLFLAFGMNYGAAAVITVFAGLGSYALTHFVQMRWFVKVRFDDKGITMIRPWRRQRIEWYQIAGLIYRSRKESYGRSGYELRLVLVGHEPSPHPATPRQTRLEADGPVVMLVGDIRVTNPRAGGRCEEAVLEELAEHGFPRPERKELCFRPSEDVNPNVGPDH